MSTKNTIKKGIHFVNEVMARLEGDSNKVVAEKNARLAIAALTAQSAALTGAIVKQEMAVEAAEEALKEAQYPITIITDAQSYCDNITKYQNALNEAVGQLTTLSESKDSFDELLGEL